MLNFSKGEFPELPFEFHGYEFLYYIGSGSFASVVKARNISNGHFFAAKIVDCSVNEKAASSSTKAEIECLINILHPNIIKIYDYFKEGNFLFIIIEYCSKGNMEDYCKPLTERQKLLMIKQILNAVQCSHKQGIAHRDIKPANIFISESGLVKLGDFGLGINMKGKETINEFSGSFIYKAPEVIKRVPYSPFKSDIWSLGVTFYRIAIGVTPWGRTKSEIKENILSGKYSFPKNTSPSIISIIEKMLVVDPEKRPTVEELLSNPYLVSLRLTYVPAYAKCDIKELPICMRVKKLKINIKKSNSTGGTVLAMIL